ncbi:SurA N-terminal domain-containing protein [Uliginosibacterium sp. 31-12]|uniref:SurA N-terminal domain-containing protein n=1 Tax=Uliginosibacterium sp. 31-12 TaxID=3062781 RepID=UPI0026E1E446|nr:SurA N-terminal domain-containing protein [Uliginosibacterium sp. 31-12]MDO6385214.1 SurA N-terminal domain-containing protein [Uliginosibacterium sp. 31-12]
MPVFILQLLTGRSSIMFDAVRNNPKIVQLFLALITLPFAFFGVDAYFRNGGPGADAVAKVGKVEISSYQLDQAVRDQENSLREQLGGAFDKAYVESPAFKTAVLDRLINETALKGSIADSRLVVSAEAVQSYIKSEREFQENGQFSFPMYEARVRAMGLTPAAFEQRVREGMAQQQLMLPIAYSAFAPAPSVQYFLALEAEERSVAELVFDAAGYASKVKLTDDAARKYYDANQARFQTPEQVRLEYIQLSLESITRNLNVTEADARKWYDENQKAFEGSEERRASHILVQVPADAKPEVRAAARKKAEDILAQVKSMPAKFAELAKSASDDPGSAEKGGDLGFFGRGAMVKPFEDAAFALKQREISGLVETEFGYHIIQLTDSRGGKAKSYDEVKADAMAGARKQMGNQRFAELADQFGNMVYEQPDALKPVADKFSLPLVQTDWLAREALPPLLRNAKLQAALFSADSLQNRRNTEAVDLGNGVVISARILDHKPVATRSFDEVKSQAEELARAEEASRLALADGEVALKKLQAGEVVSGGWKSAKSVKRGSPELSADSRKAIFAVSTDKFPVYAGSAHGDAYSVYRIEKVNKGAEVAPAELVEARRQFALTLGQEDLRAYIAGIRNRQGVQVKTREATKAD